MTMTNDDARSALFPTAAIDPQCTCPKMLCQEPGERPKWVPYATEHGCPLHRPKPAGAMTTNKLGWLYREAERHWPKSALHRRLVAKQLQFIEERRKQEKRTIPDPYDLAMWRDRFCARALSLRLYWNRPRMAVDRAKATTEACVRNRVAIELDGTYAPLPQDCTLAEMLEANAIVKALPPEPNGDGTKRLYVHVDPRGIAASYAFERYGRSPAALLEAVGYQFKEPGRRRKT